MTQRDVTALPLHERARLWLDAVEPSFGMLFSAREIIREFLSQQDVEMTRIAFLEARDRDATFFYDYLKHIENALDNMGVAPMEQFTFPARLVHRVTSMGGRDA